MPALYAVLCLFAAQTPFHEQTHLTHSNTHTHKLTHTQRGNRPQHPKGMAPKDTFDVSIEELARQAQAEEAAKALEAAARARAEEAERQRIRDEEEAQRAREEEERRKAEEEAAEKKKGEDQVRFPFFLAVSFWIPCIHEQTPTQCLQATSISCHKTSALRFLSLHRRRKPSRSVTCTKCS